MASLFENLRDLERLFENLREFSQKDKHRSSDHVGGITRTTGCIEVHWFSQPGAGLQSLGKREATLWSTGEGRGAAMRVCRGRRAWMEPEASSGWPAEEVSMPVLVGGLGRTGFHTEKITGRLPPTFLQIRKGNIILPFGSYFLFLEKEMATDSSILAWRVPWTEKPSRPWSIGLQRDGHD